MDEMVTISVGNRVRILVELRMEGTGEVLVPVETIGIVDGFDDPYVDVIVENIHFRLLPMQFEVVSDAEEQT